MCVTKATKNKIQCIWSLCLDFCITGDNNEDIHDGNDFPKRGVPNVMYEVKWKS